MLQGCKLINAFVNRDISKIPESYNIKHWKTFLFATYDSNTLLQAYANLFLTIQYFLKK